MGQRNLEKVAAELDIEVGRVQSTAALLEEGGTVPFIARYRKEATGSLDEVAVTAIRDRLSQLAELDRRREAILKSLDEQGVLTDELRAEVDGAETMTALEDVYLPYRPKRRTRATVAREKGLEPLAERLLAQDGANPESEALGFVDADKGVATAAEALEGARDIIAERAAENAEARARMRDLYATEGVYRTRVVARKEDEGSKYRDYFEWEEPIAGAPSHRVLAMRRGEREGMLTLRIDVPEDAARGVLEGLFVKDDGEASEQVRMAVWDGYKRLLSTSMETEARLEAKKRADEQAIGIFAQNLRELLLAPPLGQKRVLGIDPGFRTGCKLVCLDAQGKLLQSDTVYPGQGDARSSAAADTIRSCCDRHGVEAIAIGNGTGGRELESFIRGIGLPESIAIVMVNESGASVYSASEGARKEFPDYDLTVRGAVSIGRRLMDPLAELVKIDPKSIGVGQYQHDVDQGALKDSLDDVVVSCVNAVGVEVNTASRDLLTYVSGLGPQLAANIVSYRDENGPFTTRDELKSVPRLGPKAFEQAAGFLRIRNGPNPLDASAVHPESYGAVDAMADDLGRTVSDLMRDDGLRKGIDLDRYVSDTIGLPTLKDIVSELAKPGRDPREGFEAFRFAEDVGSLEDLKTGMVLPGIVTNVTAFGAFVDVGVHQDGLVHISQLADRFVKDPADVVKVHQRVRVTVLEVDLPRKRISLSMRKNPSEREEGKGGGKRRREGERPKAKQRSRGTRQKDRTPNQREPRQQRSRAPKQRGALPDSAISEALRKAGLA